MIQLDISTFNWKVDRWVRNSIGACVNSSEANLLVGASSEVKGFTEVKDREIHGIKS